MIRDNADREPGIRPVQLLPTHYRDDDPRTGEKGALCPYSQLYPPCPLGCAGATEHYANDGHAECEEK